MLMIDSHLEHSLLALISLLQHLGRGIFLGLACLLACNYLFIFIWTILKVFIEFVTILLLCYVLVMRHVGS